MDLIHIFAEYPWLSAVCLWVFAVAIHTMPKPLATERWYGWFHDFLQAVGANIDRVGEKKPPAV